MDFAKTPSLQKLPVLDAVSQWSVKSDRSRLSMNTRICHYFLPILSWDGKFHKEKFRINGELGKKAFVGFRKDGLLAESKEAAFLVRSFHVFQWTCSKLEH